MAERYIIVLVQIVGNPDAGFNNVYYSDLVPHSTRQAAIHHGMRLYDHDDFLLGILRGIRLAGLAWQYEDRDDPDELAEAAAHLGLEVAS